MKVSAYFFLSGLTFTEGCYRRPARLSLGSANTLFARGGADEQTTVQPSVAISGVGPSRTSGESFESSGIIPKPSYEEAAGASSTVRDNSGNVDPVSVVAKPKEMKADDPVPGALDGAKQAKETPPETKVEIKKDAIDSPSCKAPDIDRSKEVPKAPKINQSKPPKAGRSNKKVSKPKVPAISGKMKNFQNRAGPAAALLVGLHLIVRYGQEQGLQCLTLILSPALYQEAISVTGRRPGALEWSWFLSYSLLSSLPAALSKHSDDLRLTGYLGLVLTLVGTIYRLNSTGSEQNGMSAEETFAAAMKRLAKSHICIAATVLPCACWVATLSRYPLEWVIYALVLVILNDSMAYVFGMAFGRHPLLPTISPKKTYEGYIGAWVSTMLLSSTVWKMLFTEKFGRHGWLLSLFCNTLAPFGGFVASVVKRAYGKKDFGSLIQGHGGLIDRLDCQLLTAPLLYLYLQAAVGSASPTVSHSMPQIP